jgi:hypothetical protein
MDEPKTRHQNYFRQVRERVADVIEDRTSQVRDRDAATRLSLPEWAVSYSRGFVTNLKSRTQHSDLRRLRLVFLFSDDEWARETARQLIEAEGFTPHE